MIIHFVDLFNKIRYLKCNVFVYKKNSISKINTLNCNLNFNPNINMYILNS